MKKITLTVVVCGLFVLGARAQGSLYAVEYSMGFGSNNMSNYIGKPSFRGASFEYRKFLAPNVGVGLELGWNVFYEKKSYDSYTIGAATLTGVQFRTSNHIPILISADYYLHPGEKINPFIGLGLGTLYSERSTDMGIYSLIQDAWQFSARPEVGALLELNEHTNVILAAKYYSGFNGGDLLGQSYFTVNVGLVLKQ